MERRDLELVLAVRNEGSLAGAAVTLGVVPSVVTKRLAALEAGLGQRLFERTTRRLQPTAEGQAVCAHAVTLLEGFAALESELRERQTALVGPIRLASSFGFGRRWLGPAVAAFRAQHPGLQIQLELDEHLPDLAAGGFDGAIWLWSMQERRAADWVTRRLGRNQRVLVASPDYIAQHGAPTEPAQLAQHACLTVRENGAPQRPHGDSWALRHEGSAATVRLQVGGPLVSNSGELVRDWCIAGHGIMLRSLWDIGPHLAAGRLVRVLPQHAMADADIHWLAPWRPRTPRRVRLLVDFLAECFRDEPWKPAVLSPPRRAPRAPRG